jgi:hypothetical protein
LYSSQPILFRAGQRTANGESRTTVNEQRE